jgi:hypothetical protein
MLKIADILKELAAFFFQVEVMEEQLQRVTDCHEP